MSKQQHDRPLRMGLVGGGGDGFIGKVHATAATLDREAVLVAGALSSDPERSRQSALAMGIPADRAYGSFLEMIRSENHDRQRIGSILSRLRHQITRIAR